MKYRIIPVTPLEQNCTLVWCEATAEAAIVDPGGDLESILESIRRNRVTPVRILLTHGHVDHAGGAAALARRLGLPIEGPQRADRFWLERLSQQGAMWGIPGAEEVIPDRWLEDGDRVTVGAQELEVIHCPGHSPGHLVFYHRDSQLALVGDVLFRGSIGRSDFPGGDHAALLRSIRERLWPLGAAVRFIPGHGPMSSFGEERRTNPFVRDRG